MHSTLALSTPRPGGLGRGAPGAAPQPSEDRSLWPWHTGGLAPWLALLRLHNGCLGDGKGFLPTAGSPAAPGTEGDHSISGTRPVLSKQNLHGPPGLRTPPFRGPRTASLSHQRRSLPSPTTSTGAPAHPVLPVRDMRTKCFLMTACTADAVISLDFTAISFPHRFILSYSPWILPASPEPLLPAPRLVSTPPGPRRDGKPRSAHCASTHSCSFITFSMRTATLIKTGPSSLTHFPLPITN